MNWHGPEIRIYSANVLHFKSQSITQDERTHLKYAYVHKEQIEELYETCAVFLHLACLASHVWLFQQLVIFCYEVRF